MCDIPESTSVPEQHVLYLYGTVHVERNDQLYPLTQTGCLEASDDMLETASFRKIVPQESGHHLFHGTSEEFVLFAKNL
jgi:hypothetical protein